MSNQHLQNLTEIEAELVQEGKGEGSLSVYVVRGAADASGDDKIYVGYDIHPEDLEALYFEGIKLPRWESIEAETVEQKTDIYNESFQKVTADYPLFSRVSDTDVKVVYSPEEVLQLQKECERVADTADHAKAIRALQKFYIACYKAAENQMGLMLIPN